MSGRATSRQAARRSPGLRTLLPAILLLALCPALLALAVSARRVESAEQAASFARRNHAASSLAAALDREVAGVIGALQAFATAPDLLPQSASAEAHSRRLAAQLGVPVELVARGGSTRPLSEAVQAALADGRAAVGDPEDATPIGRAIIIAVPVREAAAPVAVAATAAIGLDRLRALLVAPELEPGVVAVLMDGRGRVAARSDAAGAGAVDLPPAPLRPGLPAAPVRARALDGVERVFAVAGIGAMPGWTLLVAAPEPPAASRGFAWVAAGLAVLLTGGLLALGLAWAMRRRLLRLRDQVAALPGPPPETAPQRGLSVAELDALRLALDHAAPALRARLDSLAGALRAATGAKAVLEQQVAERDRVLARAVAAERGAVQRWEELQATLLQAQKLQALGQLAGRVSHDFNNALAVIVGGHRIIEQRTTDPALLDLIHEGDSAAGRAATLMRRLVEFARREELRPVRVDLPPLLAEVREMIGYTVGKHLVVGVELPQGLWPVRADPYRLEAALLSLAADARDALPQGASLLIAARNLGPGETPGGLRPGDHVAISLRHAGPAPGESGPGSGLALAMVRDFAAQSGGACRIDRVPGGVTSMEIVLPRAMVRDDCAVPEAPAALDPRLHGGATILLVDPEEPARARTATLLRDLGYTLAEAGDAEAAESRANWLPALDLLITAMELPATDGASLAARLRADRAGLPVLFLTAFEPGPSLAGELVLRRPAAEADLAGAVLDLLQRRRSLLAAPPGIALLRRLRTPSLRAAYLTWHAARLAGEALPRRANLDLARLDLAEHCALVAVDLAGAEPGFRFVSVGRALTDRLGRGLDGTSIGPEGDAQDVPGSLQAAYRRSARTRAPVYESANFDFGDGPPLRFERVTLPLSEDGEVVSHLLGVVLFHEDAAPGTPQAVPAG